MSDRYDDEDDDSECKSVNRYRLAKKMREIFLGKNSMPIALLFICRKRV